MIEVKINLARLAFDGDDHETVRSMADTLSEDSEASELFMKLDLMNV